MTVHKKTKEFASPDLEFRNWFNKNHPFDWWAKERKGIPLSDRDRLLVWSFCRKAWMNGNGQDD